MKSKKQFPVSRWNDRRLRVGWHIRNARGQIGIVRWIANGHITYTLETSTKPTPND